MSNVPKPVILVLLPLISLSTYPLDLQRSCIFAHVIEVFVVKLVL